LFSENPTSLISDFTALLFSDHTFFIDPKIWIMGLGFVVVGLVWHTISLKLQADKK